MIKLGILISKMNQASKDCIHEGKKRKFTVFNNEQDPDERTGKLLRDLNVNDCEQEEEEEEESDADCGDEIPEPIIFDEGEENASVFTKKYGNLNFQTAETLLLNGGRSSISAISRTRRFTSDVFGIASDIPQWAVGGGRASIDQL